MPCAWSSSWNFQSLLLAWRACMHVYRPVDFIVYNKNKYRFRYVGEHLQHLILQYQLPNENTYYIRIPAHLLFAKIYQRKDDSYSRWRHQGRRWRHQVYRWRHQGYRWRHQGYRWWHQGRSIHDFRTEGVKVRETLMGVLGTCSQGRRSLFYHKWFQRKTT